jgi:DNA topoisomerase-1
LKKKKKKVDVKCEKCGADMVVKRGKNGEFLACSNYPECKNTKPLNAPEVLEDVKCPECGGDIVKRKSRRGEFYGCSNYPECNFISKYRPTNEKCDECGYIMAKRTYRGKEVLECIKCKTRKSL